MARPVGSGVTPVVERFWRMVEKGPGCWRWMGATAHGYGVIGVRRGKNTGAHRLSYEIHYGPVPADRYVCHHCDNPRCVRPDHLFIGTAKDNVQDMMSKGRENHEGIGPWQARKTHCKRGHPFNDENTQQVAGGRRCRTCHRDAERQRARLRTTTKGQAQ